MESRDQDMVARFMEHGVTPEQVGEFAAQHGYVARRRTAAVHLAGYTTFAVCRGRGRLLSRRAEGDDAGAAPWILSLPAEGLSTRAVWELWPVEDVTRPVNRLLAVVILLASGLISVALLAWLGERAGLWGWPW
jgi:hypothetical protein